ncbi:MAG: hypothetical protein A2074_05205 [Candidatus Aquicultor primus]|uniref:Uncharacterized protein n=1 Tax=Candidatus Aquicultor primus TaxID=1797195 RepID=A0A1F2UMK3_9ACTN|nr:MAG: hypothetical protein A2074_05205 [Candidatus Aquicultor primus]HCG99909.1 hypothetical protein [Actinomycetota bacterium]
MKSKRVILTIVLVGIMLSLTATANAYVVFRTWPNSNNVYYVTTTALGSESVTAFGNANIAWNNVANANKNIYRSGSTSATSVSRNGTNEVVKYYISSSGPLMATSVWQSNGYIAEFDMAINAAFNWRTDGAPNAYDVQNCATH